MRFVDQARISIHSGHGGRGAVSFHREKYVPKGGPDGGDGGRGGDVVIEASPRLATLYDFTRRRVFKAQNGQPGGGNQRSGAAGEDLVVPVPLGTLVFNEETDDLLADLVKPGQRLVAAKGGRGGKGNKHFATSRHRTPRFAQPGEEGESFALRLDLKLLADIALVGLPNAGKSTLVSRISAARPKIAPYPFTTLTPNLGVVHWPGHDPFVVADIPGLIKGASLGLGLGHQFLRHVQRTRFLVFLLDATGDPAEDLAVLESELAAFSPDLARQERIVALNKIDLLEPGTPEPESPAPGEPTYLLSALTGQGVAELAQALAQRMDRFRALEKDDPGERSA